MKSIFMGPGLLRPLVDPPSVPPTATFVSKKMLWLNGHVSPEGRLLGVTVKNGVDALSTKNCISFCVQMTPYVWKAVSAACPLGNVNRDPTPLPPVFAVWMVELFPAGPGPFRTCGDQFSMKSASPHVGQGTVLMLLPRLQNAGHRPGFVVLGNSILASRIPNWKFCLFWVFMRAD